MKNIPFIIFCVILLVNLVSCKKQPSNYIEQKQSMKNRNPAFVKDRFKTIVKPQMPELWVNQYKPEYVVSYMDYCDPHHCNAYHRTVCGLNRRKMKFKWFQSVCHLILNNACASYRGSLKYDYVANKYCTAYVMFARSKTCPAVCDESRFSTPVCGRSVNDQHVALFESECALDKANCRLESLREYEEIDPELCLAYIINLPNTVRVLRSTSCPPKCDGTLVKNVCGIRVKDGRFRRFLNQCDMEKVNCLDDVYAETSMAACLIADVLGLVESDTTIE